MRVTAFAGGVGGAKLAEGLAQCLPAADLTIVVNTGDDFSHFGLQISPDLDTVCYMLAGLANPLTGWGRANETWHVLENLKQLGAPTWFNLGDADLAVHLERTRRLLAGDPLSKITRDFCQIWGIGPTVLPMSDDRVATEVITAQGVLPFQEYFVHQQCQPVVTGFNFQGIQQAQPAPGVLESLDSADLVVFCPSNPWVSIAPILGLPGLRALVMRKPVIALSPIIGGQAVKGPAAKMYRELGFEPSALVVAEHYRELLKGFVLDEVDAASIKAIRQWGIITMSTDTLMRDRADRCRLAHEILLFGESLLRGEIR